MFAPGFKFLHLTKTNDGGGGEVVQSKCMSQIIFYEPLKGKNEDT